MYNDYCFETQDTFTGIEKVASQLFQQRADIIGPLSTTTAEMVEENQITNDNCDSLSKKTRASKR
jgi:hypothetical protein